MDTFGRKSPAINPYYLKHPLILWKQTLKEKNTKGSTEQLPKREGQPARAKTFPQNHPHVLAKKNTCLSLYFLQILLSVHYSPLFCPFSILYIACAHQTRCKPITRYIFLIRILQAKKKKKNVDLPELLHMLTVFKAHPTFPREITSEKYMAIKKIRNKTEDIKNHASRMEY